MTIASWFGIGKEIATPIDAVGKAVDAIFTSDEERLDRQAVLEGIRNSPYMAAMQIAMVQAGSSDRWTSRARPMLIYAFCLVFVVDRAAMPLLWWLLQVFHDVAVPPPPSLLSSDMIMTTVAGVLGTSWIASRGVEKIKGMSR